MTGELHMHLRADGINVVHAPRDLTAANAHQLRTTFIALTADGARRAQIVVDLGATETADSLGLGSLLGGNRRANVRGGAFVLADADTQIEQQLRSTGVLKVIALYASASAAIDALIEAKGGSDV